MKISLYIPQGKTNAIQFIKDEIAEAKSIKNKKNRFSTLRGLNKLLNVIRENVSGISIFTDGKELKVEQYNGRKQIYYCGKQYKQLPVAINLPQLLVVVDANEATIGKTNGEQIDVIWHERSLVPRKHRAGGQSHERFARGREQALKQWLRKVTNKIKETVDDRKIIIGGPGMTKDQLIKEFPV